MSSYASRKVAVIGAGPAGLIAAETLARAGMGVTVFDRMPSVGRKLLIAGRGGLNLTHGEPFERFVARYAEAAGRLRPALEAFPPERLRAWADGLGAETFIGSSGRVFPRAWKASPLLRAWLRRLDDLGVEFRLRHRWTGFGPAGELRFETPAGPASIRPDAAILALGGGSWPRLGSDGGWVSILQQAGVRIRDLVPANAGLRVAWSDRFLARFEGAPLKRIALAHGGRDIRGEANVTKAGLEGGAVYAVAGSVRDAVAQDGEATLRVDLRPDLPADALAKALSRERGKQSMASFLRKAAGLPPAAIGLMREGYGPALAADPPGLAAAIKAVPLRVVGTDSLDRAISSAGGILLDEIDEHFMLKRLPGIFAAGEMLDWEAPTGGYLLQACFATGVAAAEGVLRWGREAGPAQSTGTA
ncbi:TIGR03862 family flavoprotein [Enterovirga aerilata]|uniref:TIGR03862 family flavoprotein n=1 Tax=Enterovirga aerilata TaxID=2730920 RepID=A0A849I4V6_9HYPH|nr:TIGR03862 family flavoprotein [Enterovirga sp. DB1703]NNM71150.1 TIGR03862 family flavoprotein [Enterovirga sp. DB1703]